MSEEIRDVCDWRAVWLHGVCWLMVLKLIDVAHIVKLLIHGCRWQQGGLVWQQAEQGLERQLHGGL